MAIKVLLLHVTSEAEGLPLTGFQGRGRTEQEERGVRGVRRPKASSCCQPPWVVCVSRYGLLFSAGPLATRAGGNEGDTKHISLWVFSLCVWWGDSGQSFRGLLVALAKLLLVRMFCCRCTAGMPQSLSSVLDHRHKSLSETYGKCHNSQLGVASFS